MIIIKLIQDVLKKTQSDIAQDLEVSRQTISMWLSGYKISKKHIMKLNKVYNIPIEYIQKSQEDGCTFSNSEIEYIKKCLIDRKMVIKGDLVYELLNIIASKNYYCSTNFSFLISKMDYSNIIVENYKNGTQIDKSHIYLFLITLRKNELKDVINELSNIFELENVMYIVKNGNEDSIKIIISGGQ